MNTNNELCTICYVRILFGTLLVFPKFSGNNSNRLYLCYIMTLTFNYLYLKKEIKISFLVQVGYPSGV